MNLLHCLDDVKTVLKEMKRVLAVDGKVVLATLVMSNRWSDNYLNMLARSGAIVPRSPGHLLSAFNEIDMPVKHQIKGNLAFIKYRCVKHYISIKRHNHGIQQMATTGGHDR